MACVLFAGCANLIGLDKYEKVDGEAASGAKDTGGGNGGTSGRSSGGAGNAGRGGTGAGNSGMGGLDAGSSGAGDTSGGGSPLGGAPNGGEGAGNASGGASTGGASSEGGSGASSGTSDELGGAAGEANVPSECRLPVLSEACNGCIKGRCSSECKACRQQVACVALVHCWDACAQGDRACYTACLQKHEPTAGAAAQDFLGCAEDTLVDNPCAPCADQSLSSPM
nr:MAG: hypothetical protein DIU78_26335 [Pseudomonadota bacterium]